MKTDCQVAVVGAGIAGSLAAIQLSDRGFDVLLVDHADGPMRATSRWNEGKIHLGYCYLGDASLKSAQLMVDGAACFVDDIERLCGTKLKDHWFSQPVVYLVDPHSQFKAGVLWSRAQQIAAFMVEQAGRDARLRRWVKGQTVLEKIDPAEASCATGLDHVASAWVTSERAIAPGPVAELIRAAVQERGIPYHQAEVLDIAAVGHGWKLGCGATSVEAKTVVNASWESRARLDRGVSGRVVPCSTRYKYGLFFTGVPQLGSLAPSTRIVGRFGDVTPYGNGEAYLGWYPAGLAGSTDEGLPPEISAPDEDRIFLATLDGLGLNRSLLGSPGARLEVRGGFVVASGYGDIDTAQSPLHHRDQCGSFELAPGYVSVDTGKYSLGPLMAARAADLITQHIADSRVWVA